MATNLKSNLLAIAVLILTCLAASAQTYTVDGVDRDSVYIFPVMVSKTDTVLNTDTKRLEASGLELEYAGKTIHYNGTDYAIMYSADGEEVAIQPKYLAFSAKDGSETINPLQDGIENLRHTELGHFFHTKTPYVLILIILSVAVLMIYLLSTPLMGSLFLALVLMILVALAIFSATALELGAFIFTDFNPTWWMDSENVGFFKSLFLLLPLWLVVGFQLVASLGLYNNMDKINLDTTSSWITLLVCTISAIVIDLIIIIVTAIAHVDPVLRIKILSYATLITMGLGIVGSLCFTFSKFKPWVAPILTIVDLVIVLGVVAIGFVFLLAVIKFFLKSLIYIVVGGFILMLMSGKGEHKEASKTPTKKEESYEDFLKKQEKRDEADRLWWGMCKNAGTNYNPDANPFRR